MTDRHRTELVRRPKDSRKCTWADHVGRFSAKHLHLKSRRQRERSQHGKCHLLKQKVSPMKDSMTRRKKSHRSHI
ncbi:hypothetical protein DPMN_118231 [Dreissena polymorpha]|uniref:Uncharacterized protein n=1 Tax=Dreissena polymorpha TaxID=45954 RepID=A0A9D4JLP6_DREPO|nr:hypothetical protein DPMN_118231 [Dreissena polymorpha]